MTTLAEIINTQDAGLMTQDALTRLKQLAMFKIRKNFYDERFLSIIDNKRYVALRDAKLISEDFSNELYLDCTTGERTGFIEWERKNGERRVENGECRPFPNVFATGADPDSPNNNYGLRTKD